MPFPQTDIYAYSQLSLNPSPRLPDASARPEKENRMPVDLERSGEWVSPLSRTRSISYASGTRQCLAKTQSMGTARHGGMTGHGGMAGQCNGSWIFYAHDPGRQRTSHVAEAELWLNAHRRHTENVLCLALRNQGKRVPKGERASRARFFRVSFSITQQTGVSQIRR